MCLATAVDDSRDKVRAAQNKHRAKDPAKHNARISAWRINNPHKHNAKEAKRRASLLLRTPKWCDAEELWIIEQAYELAQIRTQQFGF